MIALPPAVKIHVCVEPTDMRKSFDGLSGLAEHVMKKDPCSGHLFVFRNRARDRIKVMYWDTDGLAIWYKRLERGTFQFPMDLQKLNENAADVQITVTELNLLLGGIDLSSVKRRRRYERPHAPK